MIFGSMKEVFLTRARDMFVFDCYVGGFDPQAVNAYRRALDAFICFTGNIRVRQLAPDYVEMYIANLLDGPHEAEEYDRLVMTQYAILQTWIHWMYSQKFVTERETSMERPIDLTHLFPPRSARKLAHCE